MTKSKVQKLKESLEDLHKPFSGYIDPDEADERFREANHKYEWDAKHGLI